MSDHRNRYRYDTESETYGGFWNSANVTQQPIGGYHHQNYSQQHQPTQYYQATDSHHQQVDPYTSHQVIPLSPPSSRPVSVSPDENSLAVSSSSGSHLVPLYSTGRPSFQTSSQSYTNGIKPDPDCEDQRQHYYQHRHHNMSLEKVRCCSFKSQFGFWIATRRSISFVWLKLGSVYSGLRGGLHYLRKWYVADGRFARLGWRRVHLRPYSGAGIIFLFIWLVCGRAQPSTAFGRTSGTSLSSVGL